MDFFYNPRKAAQAVAYLVSLSGGSIDLWTMLKLVYLFDRESLIKTGSPVTGDDLYSLQFGPTPSRIYDNTKTDREDCFKDAVWREYLTESVNNTVHLQNEVFRTDELSQFERDLIRQTWEQFGKLSFKELYDLVHNLPEYKDPKGSRLPIAPEEILRYCHWTEEEIKSAERDAKRENLLNQICR